MKRLKLTKAQKTAFDKKNIETINHLHRWFPLHYIDNTVETGVREDLDGQHVVVIGTLLDLSKERTDIGYRCKMHIRDRISGNRVTVMHFFGGYYIYNDYHPLIGREILFSGTLQYSTVYGYSFKKLDFMSPEIKENMKVIPTFRKILERNDKKVPEIIEKSLDIRETETVPGDLLETYKLQGINEAIKDIMFPESLSDVVRGRKRLLFDDIYYFYANMELNSRERKTEGIKIDRTPVAENVIKNLPYALTGGQMDTFLGIRESMYKGEKVSALVQGDVGCGKTIVGFLNMIAMAENGYQAAIMAPTKILAQQHYNKLCDLVKTFGIETALVTGDTINKELTENIANGKIKLLVGTHALLSEKIEFKNLGILVIDEEHRFGVKQRDLIEEKCKTIDSISMSATPIPRTMASAIFGDDIKVYSIKDKPGCRTEIRTRCTASDGYFDFVAKYLASGQQMYVVCPMINQAEKDSLMENVMSTKEAVDMYRAKFPNAVVTELTGETDSEEMEQILRDFRDNKIQILVSTTVIEVGVDVPNANLMIIQNAERFGLAQLHQLRGRVGRGDKQGFCIAVSDVSDNLKLNIFSSTTDGFEIAEQDLMLLRKSGDLFGTEQSGRNKYIDEVMMYPNLCEKIKEIVKSVPSDKLMEHVKKIHECEYTGNNRPIKLYSI